MMNPDGGGAEDKTATAAAPPAQSLHSKPAPVMDVLPPRSDAPAASQTEVAMPPDESPDDVSEAELQTAQQPEEPAAKPIKPPKQRGSSVGLAIFATVVIVLALSAMAVYAYLQTR